MRCIQRFRRTAMSGSVRRHAPTWSLRSTLQSFLFSRRVSIPDFDPHLRPFDPGHYGWLWSTSKPTRICRASGVSYRTLNYAFLERFGVAPKQYLQAIRLDGARKDLRKLGPNCAIIDAANTWGFWHMGQFGKDYKRQFGELPSETLRRHSGSF